MAAANLHVGIPVKVSRYGAVHFGVHTSGGGRFRSAKDIPVVSLTQFHFVFTIIARDPRLGIQDIEKNDTS